MEKSIGEMLSEIEFLLRGYSNVFRASVQPYRHENKRRENPAWEFDPEDKEIRESLMEHIGILPILAVYFHPHMDKPVDLGKALGMLAIHDIGELALGDRIIFTKEDGREELESKEALKILDKKFHQAYLEFREGKTNEARFARSIDKIAPDIFDCIVPKDVTAVRLKHFANIWPGEIVPTIEKFKSPYMQWSGFFREFHAGLMDKLREKFSK